MILSNETELDKSMTVFAKWFGGPPRSENSDPGHPISVHVTRRGSGPPAKLLFLDQFLAWNIFFLVAVVVLSGHLRVFSN
jgi:hypothetical protein